MTPADQRDKLIEAMARDLQASFSHDPADWEMMAPVCESLLTVIAEGYAVVPREATEAIKKALDDNADALIGELDGDSLLWKGAVAAADLARPEPPK